MGSGLTTKKCWGKSTWSTDRNDEILKRKNFETTDQVTSCVTRTKLLPRNMIVIQQILVGFSKEEGPKTYADGSVTLVKSDNFTILFDCASPKNKSLLLQKLSDHGTTPESVTHLICSHGHSDHTGNMNLFENAVVYLANDILKPDGSYESHDFQKEEICNIVEIEDESLDVYLMATPGHTDHCLSLVVENGDDITVVVGDLFENENDVLDSGLWRANSKYPESQELSREKVLEIADFIIPGHGKMFENSFADN